MASSHAVANPARNIVPVAVFGRRAAEMVLQVQLARRVDALPIARDYIHAAEAAGPAPASPPRRAGAAAGG